MANISLVKVGAVCAILTAVSVIVAIILIIGFSGLDDPDPKVDEVVQWMLDVEDDGTFLLAGSWFVLLSVVLALAAGLGFYHALRESGGLMWIALTAWTVGILMLISAFMIRIGMAYEFAPGYVEAGADAKSTLEVVGNTLAVLIAMLHIVGNLLLWGIGLALFSVAIIRTSVVPKWVGWLGLAVALLGGWLGALGPASEVFDIIGDVGFFAFLVWLLAMGFALLGRREAPAV